MTKKGAKITIKKETNTKINQLLIENFINLQKVLANNAEKLEELTQQISKLLQLFEISAKSFVEKIDEKVNDVEKDKEFLNKLNSLVDQNKLIAKGLTLMEENIRERVYGGQVPQMQQRPISRPMQRQPLKQFQSSEFIPSISKQEEESE